MTDKKPVEDTYTVSVACTNCDWSSVVQMPKGWVVGSQPCPSCSCYKVEKVKK